MRLKDLLRFSLCIIALGLIFRIFVAFYLGDVIDAPPLLTDQRSYHALGARLLQGHGYTFDTAWYPFTPPNTPTAHWSFLYPLFVAAVYAVCGVHPLAVRLLQAVLGGILLPWMVYRLARRLGELARAARPEADAETGLGWSGLPTLAAALAAVYGYFILCAATVMTETFYIVAVLWSLERSLAIGAHLRAGRRAPHVLALQLGLSLALATLLRQSILPWVPVLFLWLLWQARVAGRLWKAALPLALAGMVLILGLAPWTVRNYRVYGRFLLLNSNTGYAMYSAQHPMHGVSFREYAAAPLPRNLQGRNEAEWDGELLRIGLQFVRAEPGRYLRLCLSRVRAYFEFWPTPDTTLLHNIGRTGSFGLFLPLMLYGLYLTVTGRCAQATSQPRVWGLSLLYIFMVFYPLLHILTWAMVRYRLPVDAMNMILVALALRDLYGRARIGFLARATRTAVPGQGAT